MGFFLRLFFYGFFLSGFGLLVFSFLQTWDVSKVIHNHTPGPCKVIPGIEHGSEDVDILPNGKAIFTTGLTWSPKLHNSAKPGFMSFDISTPDAAAKELKISGYKGFLNPHGLSLFLEGTKVYVYVVNHPPFNQHPPADVVEKFLWDVEKGTLIFQKTFSDPEFVGLNDLVVVEADKFYATNLQSMKSKILREIELFLFFVPLQNVVYFNGKKAEVVLTGLYGPNGIDISPDKKFLYLAEVHKKRVNSYRITSGSQLIFEDSKNLGAVPDNINVNQRTGDLWIGCHPVYHQLFWKLFVDPKAKSPSQILRVGVKDGKFVNSADVYVDDGSVVSGSSTAAFHKGKNVLLIGSIDEKAVYCKM